MIALTVLFYADFGGIPMRRKMSLWIASGLFAFACVFFFGKLITTLVSAKIAGVRAAQVMRQSIASLDKEHDSDMTRIRTELLLAGLENETALHALRNRDADAYDQAQDSVFFLTVHSQVLAADGKTVRAALEHFASGSVFVVDGVIYLATSSHAVTTVKFPFPNVRVTNVYAHFPSTGTTEELDALGYSKECDIVLLAPKARGRATGRPLRLAAHDSLRRGMRVMSLGILPSGRATSFATYGEINAIDVAIGNNWLPRLVVSSPYLLHGFSGGPLVSVDTGEMVGLNGRSKEDGVSQVPLALPAEAIRLFLPRLLMPGRMHHGSAGATLADGPNSTTLSVRDVVAKGPADAKLQKGDLVTAIDGSPVRSLFYAELQILAATPGTTMRFTGTRDGKPFEADIVLVSLDNE